MKTNKIHELNTIFLLLVIERFSSAIEYYFQAIVEMNKGIWVVERLKNKFYMDEGEKQSDLSSKIISRDFI